MSTHSASSRPPLSVSDEWHTTRADHRAAEAVTRLRARAWTAALAEDLTAALTAAVTPYPARRYDYQLRRIRERDWTVDRIRRVGWV